MSEVRPRPSWIRRLAPWLWPHRRNVAIAFGGALLGSAIMAATPAVERQVIDNVIIVHRSPLAPWIEVLVAFALVAFAATYLRRFYGGRLSLDVQYDLRTAIYDQLQRLDFARHDELQTGQLVSRANSDVTLIQALLSYLPIMSGNIVLLAASLVLMFVFSPLLATVSLVAVPVMLVVTYRMRERTFPANWDAQQKEGEVAVVVEEAVTGVRVVKGFGQERRELDRLVDQARILYGSNVRAVRIQSRYQPILQAIPQLAQVAVLAFGGYLALRHQITIGTFLAFSTYLLQLSSPTRQVANVLLIAQQARAGVERVLDLLASSPVVTEKPGAEILPAMTGRISFEDVSFGYLEAEPVLRHLSLDVAPGETVALVGPSGSGKSTVALLLPRFYDAQQGAVRVDGTDVRDVTLDSLRRQIGVVFEESFLFSDTVRTNIAYGRPDATDAEVVAAAKMAEAHEFIAALPEGYDTAVGERGLTLSGGQRQRIALARALITDPRILVLDDATSAVDSRIEEEIHATLRRVMEGRTTLLIAHRRSTLRLAHRIAVLDEGRVVDQGTHEELLGRCKLYRLLLAGPDEDIETPHTATDGTATDGTATDGTATDGTATDGTATDGPTEAGITPSPWAAEGNGRVAGTTRASLGAGLGRHGGGGGHSWVGVLAPTPELLAKVDALPPVRDEPDVDLARETSEDRAFSLRRFVRPYRRPLLLGLLLVALDAAASLAGPILIRSGLDNGVARGSLDALWLASGLFLVITLADLIDSVYEILVTGATAERLLFALRVRIWSQLQRLSLDFYEREIGGRIMTRMTTDIDAFSTLLETGLINAIVSLLTIAGIGVALVIWNWRLAAATTAVVAPLAVATVVYRRLSARAYARARERIAVVNADMQESLSGIREAQAFVRERRNEAHFEGLAQSYLNARLTAQRLASLYSPFAQFLSNLGTALVLGVGTGLVAGGSLTTGELVGFLLYLDLFFSPIQQLSQTFDSYQQAGASLAQIKGLMAQRTLTPLPDHPRDPGRLTGRLALRDVRFAYPATPASEALAGVDLEIGAGETVALVGETGAGKSTIVKLLTRFYDPTAGRVTADGTDLRDLDLTGYRQQLGYVPQEAHLFSGTIRDNIAYARPEASDAEVEAAARAVGAHDFIARLPGGYLHEVSERGRSLSTGQRQLIALARALLPDPAVLLLDEATSNLDLATEARVVRAMGIVAAGRTAVLIAHRLQTARRADRIVVMDGGRVAEEGTHDDLLARDGIYASMWEAFEVGAPAGVG